MNETNRVIAHYLDGRVVKGTTEDFHPERRQFHLHPLEASAAVVIDNRQLKAVFFVRDFVGNPGRKDLRGFGLVSGEQTQGKKIAIEFKDGERIQGYTLAYTPDRQGFFVVPADPRRSLRPGLPTKSRTKNTALRCRLSMTTAALASSGCRWN